jgi:hypothetical protein
VPRIESSAENTFVFNLAMSTVTSVKAYAPTMGRILIGGYRPDPSKKNAFFRGTSASNVDKNDPLRYTNWAAGEPNGDGHNIVMYTHDSKSPSNWNDQPFSDAVSPVCRKRGKRHRRPHRV